MKRKNDDARQPTWSMAGDPCPTCGGFDTLVINYEGLTIHSLKPGSRYRRGAVVAPPYTWMSCRECGYEEERRGFPESDSLRARARLTRRSGGPRPPRRLG